MHGRLYLFPGDASQNHTDFAAEIFELLQGHLMFNPTANEKGGWTAVDSHLAQMMDLFGPVPLEMLRKGIHSSRYFDEDGIHRLSLLEGGCYANNFRRPVAKHSTDLSFHPRG